MARIVWQKRQATVREVLEALPPNHGLELKTVQTYLRRLEAKGYLRTKLERGNRIYSPRRRRHGQPCFCR